jgi:hypothetical protein
MADNELFYAVPEITDSFERVHSEMWDMSFELPSVGFVLEPYESAAAEVDMIFIYCGDNTGEDAYEAAEKQLQSDNLICITRGRQIFPEKGRLCGKTGGSKPLPYKNSA